VFKCQALVAGIRAAANAVPSSSKGGARSSVGGGVTGTSPNDASVALLLLVDQALAAPDYATLGRGRDLHCNTRPLFSLTQASSRC